MRKLELSFSQGEPLPASKVNSLVGSTAEISEGATHEHSPEGVHISPRFEVAMGVLEFDSNANEWVLSFGDRIEPFQTYPNGMVECVMSTEAGAPMQGSRAYGVIAYDNSGEEVPYQPAGIDSDGVHFGILPSPGVTMLFITAIARREMSP